MLIQYMHKYTSCELVGDTTAASNLIGRNTIRRATVDYGDTLSKASSMIKEVCFNISRFSMICDGDTSLMQ